MSNVDLTAQRALLVDRLTAILRRNEAVTKHLRQEDGRLEADFSDRVSYTQMDEVLERLDEDGRAEAGALRDALQRIDDGVYGVCASCGAGVGAGRLAAIPEAALCVKCATAAQA